MYNHSEDALQVDQQTLVQAWQQTLPEKLEPWGKATVLTDEAVPEGFRIHIDNAGRQMYSFDFACAYVDSREVNVQLVDVERDGQTVDERTEVIQEMTQNYIRHIHECAQALQSMTHKRS